MQGISLCFVALALVEGWVLQLHEYVRESGECAEWIGQQMGTARSADLGQDYEHLELLLARFQEFKLLVQAGEEKFKACDSLAKRLDQGGELALLHADVDVKGRAQLDPL
jgi:hypothetical protein